MGAHKFVTLFVAFYEAGPLKRGHMWHTLAPTQRQTARQRPLDVRCGKIK